jgi:hypothetical protein
MCKVKDGREISIITYTTKHPLIFLIQYFLKLAELLSSAPGNTLTLNLQNVETDSLGQGAAFTNRNNIPSIDTNESRRAVGSQILVSLFVTAVLLDVVQVFTTNDDGAFHLGAHDSSSKDTATNGNVTSEGALLVNVSTSNGFLGSDKTQTDVLVPTSTLALGNDTLVVSEDSVLFLERFMVLKREIK